MEVYQQHEDESLSIKAEYLLGSETKEPESIQYVRFPRDDKIYRFISTELILSCHDLDQLQKRATTKEDMLPSSTFKFQTLDDIRTTICKESPPPNQSKFTILWRWHGRVCTQC